tara:strand:- start:91 stop:342 length:252 start_codon:yes stop_codon:yes gene_type:complete
MSFKNNKYQGWKNYYTWNAALYIDNDYSTYIAARDFMGSYTGRSPYIDFINTYGLIETGDGVSYKHRKISRRELNSFMKELIR